MFIEFNSSNKILLNTYNTCLSMWHIKSHHCIAKKKEMKNKQTNKQTTKEQGVGLGIHGWKNPKRK